MGLNWTVKVDLLCKLLILLPIAIPGTQTVHKVLKTLASIHASKVFNPNSSMTWGNVYSKLMSYTNKSLTLRNWSFPQKD